MKKILLILLVAATPCYAGTTFQDLQSKMTIIPILKGANDDELIYRIKDLKKAAMAMRPLEAQAFIISELIYMREAQAKIVEKVFDDRLLALVLTKDHDTARHLIFGLWNDLAVATSSSPVDISVVMDQINLVMIKVSTREDHRKEAEELAKIVEIIRAAREVTQRALSKDDLARLLLAANEAKHNAVLSIINPALNELQKGASVFCGSVVVE